MLNTLSLRATTLLIAFVYLATIIGAWIFEYAGYLPCELCLMQRWAYYGLVPVALLLALWNPSWLRGALAVLGLVLVGNAIFGVFHSGVEWGWWQGPTTCSGGAMTMGLPDLSKPAVMCNEAAIRILGLSLAGWNAVISGVLAVIAFAAVKRG
ncbi:MAG: disulfide bond formation protein B [Proteobacteria bacterium]|nr:disulfide bond formation protein B [Pseudomonadota bacterium]